jgi:hypothetical protein
VQAALSRQVVSGRHMVLFIQALDNGVQSDDATPNHSLLSTLCTSENTEKFFMNTQFIFAFVF